MSLITISLGSNIEPKLNLEKAINEIAKFAALEKTSKIYKSKSVGFEGNDFLNQVILCEVKVDLEETYCKLKKIEKEMGRVKNVNKFSDRLIDLDLLTFNDEISEIFPPEQLIPSAGQGIIALQCREGDEEIISILKKINHNETIMRAHVERNILKVLEGDCETAVGAHSIIKDDKIIVEAELFSLDGTKRFYEKKTGKAEDFIQIGKEVGQILKTKSNNSYKR